MLELSFISWLFMGLVIWACSYKTWTTFQKEEVETLKDFSIFFFHLGLFFVIMGLPGLLNVELSAEQLGAFYIFGHIFLYTSFAYYSRIPARILKPEWTNRVFTANLMLGAAITIVNFSYWPLPEVHASGVTALNVTGPIGPMIGVLAALNWIFGGTALFAWRASKKTGKDRFKFALVAISFIFLSIAGPMHDNTTSLRMLIVADVATFLGVALMMAGVFYNREMATDIPDYGKAFKVIIWENHEIVGDVAYTEASTLDYVSIEDGEIELEKDVGEDEITEIVDIFKQVQGVSANGVARRALEGKVESHHYTELPAEILPFKVKAQKFLGL